MSGVRKRRDLLQELERTEKVLEVLYVRVSNLNSILEPLEREMRVTDFASSGVFVQGESRGIVCVLSGLIKGDPLERVLSKKKGSGIPALIKAGDRSESPTIVESIVNMVHAEDKKKPVEYVVNLRWSAFPEPIDKENIMIVGSRYSSGRVHEVKRLKAELEALGVVILEDDGEYGGGLLVYEFIRSFKNKTEPLVIELTLSHKMSENVTVVARILNVLAAF